MKPKSEAAPARQDDGTHKLQKVLAQAGLGSRRKMEELMLSGRVTVNGQPATIGMRVGPRDVIRVGDKLLRRQEEGRTPEILLYHKSEGEIVSRDDPGGRRTVFEGLPKPRDGKWLAIGRLDYNTCGLLVFTTSGELANRLMHPRYEIEREYAVRVLGRLTPEQQEKLVSGVQLEDGVAKCEFVRDDGGEGANHWYRLAIREGRNREVRRLFEMLGLTVSRLMRVRFGSLSLPPQLKRGQSVELPPEEARQLLASLGLETVRPVTDRAPGETRPRRRGSRSR